MNIYKYVCIHGHFYQPPRESAWIETIELQESAAPFHDWNERINFECYAPNTASRMLDSKGAIKKITNNYAQISFNIGPTLLSWMEKADPDAYEAILEADRQSVARFGGHGNAIAQAYNHLIMPLANEQTRKTQIRWGIDDFESRFGRKPEGMWLPETAVDTATLEALVDQGIRFTILAPRQAKAFRKIDEIPWFPCQENIDTRRAYTCILPSGKQIALFFYDGNVAKDVAFQGLLNSGELFAKRMISVFDADDTPQLSHIATDGESYGHHHRWGEMALSHCLEFIDNRENMRVTNYGEFLDLFPPQFEVMIHQNSSWSCVHGVERWRSDCGCNTGSQPGWNQAWRGPLRDSLDWLRDTLLQHYEEDASQLVNNIWDARNDYIHVVLDRSNENIDQFVKRHARGGSLDKAQRINLLRLLEIQRQCMLMYTSCAWFFAEVSGIETNQVLQYALRATYHHYNATGESLVGAFLRKLENVPSNVFKSAAESFRTEVMPSQLTLTGAGMHYAASSIFEDYEDTASFLHFIVKNEVFERIPAGGQMIAFGRTTVISRLTYSEKSFSFAVLYLGQQHMIGSISLEMDRVSFDYLQAEMTAAFQNANLGDVINMIQTFGTEKFSFKNLFKDEKLKIYKQILANSFPAVDTAINDYYEDNYQLMNGMLKNDIPVPKNWQGITQFVVEQSLHRFFENGKLSVKQLRNLVAECKLWNIKIIDHPKLTLISGERIFKELKKIEPNQAGTEGLKRLSGSLEGLAELGVVPELWKSQNLYYQMAQRLIASQWAGVDEVWKAAFLNFGKWLKMAV